MMDKTENYCIKTYFGSNSSLVSAIRISSFYNVNNALDDLQKGLIKNNECLKRSFNQFDSNIDASLIKILNQLQLGIENSKCSILYEEMLFPEDLLRKAADVLSVISPKQYESNHEVKLKLDTIVKCVKNSMQRLLNDIKEPKISNKLFDSLSKLYVNYPSLFREEFEEIVTSLVSNPELSDVRGDKMYSIIKNDCLNLFYVISCSSVLFQAMLQTLLHYCVETKLDAVVIHISQSLVEALHLFWNSSVCDNFTVNPIDMYPEPLQAVIMLIQTLVQNDVKDNDGVMETFDDEISSGPLVKQILIKLSSLLITFQYNYITKVLLTLCIPYKLLNRFIAISKREKLEFHVLIEP